MPITIEQFQSRVRVSLCSDVMLVVGNCTAVLFQSRVRVSLCSDIRDAAGNARGVNVFQSRVRVSLCSDQPIAARIRQQRKVSIPRSGFSVF